MTDADYRLQLEKMSRALSCRRRAMRIIWAASQGRVMGGPFRGLVYLQDWKGSPFTQKLLGTYELEIAGVVDGLRHRSYRRVIDIGAGEGYYACGLTYLLPQIRMKAYEADADSRGALQRIALLNDVKDRIELAGMCDLSLLAADLREQRSDLVICDIEGGEADLLDPAAIPELKQVDLLVETHEGLRPGVTTLLSERFRDTHQVHHLHQRVRVPDDLPGAVTLPEDLALCAMDELRGDGLDWLWLTSTSR